MDRYRGAWPEVELDLTGGFSFAPLPALARGEIDLVVTSDPLDLQGIVYRPLFQYEALLAVSRHHRLAARRFVLAEDLAEEVLITYPVERDRLEVFTRFLDPADVEPASLRTAELTAMTVQLVASGRGVTCLPNWALTEYLQNETIMALKMGKRGLWGTLYAAVRTDQAEQPFMKYFVSSAIETSFGNLTGGSVVPPKAAAS